MTVIDNSSKLKKYAEQIRDLFPSSVFCHYAGYLFPENEIDFGQGFSLCDPDTKVILFQVRFSYFKNKLKPIKQAYLVRGYLDLSLKLDKILNQLVSGSEVVIVTPRAGSPKAVKPFSGVSPEYSLWQLSI